MASVVWDAFPSRAASSRAVLFFVWFCFVWCFVFFVFFVFLCFGVLVFSGTRRRPTRAGARCDCDATGRVRVRSVRLARCRVATRRASGGWQALD